MELLETTLETFVSYINDIFVRSEVYVTVHIAHFVVDESYDEGTAEDGTTKAYDMTEYFFEKDGPAQLLSDEYAADMIVGILRYPNPSFAYGYAYQPIVQPAALYTLSATAGNYPMVRSRHLFD